MRDVRALGGDIEIERTRDYVRYQINTGSDRISSALTLLTEALTNGQYTVESLNAAVQDWVDTQKTISTLEQARVLANGIYDLPQKYTLEQLKAVTPQLASRYFQRFFSAKSIVFVCAGEVDNEKIRDQLNYQLAAFVTIGLQLPEMESGIEPLIADTYGKAYNLNSWAILAVTAPSSSSTEFPAFQLMVALLGVGHDARLYRSLRADHGFGYNIGVSYDPERQAIPLFYVEWSSAIEKSETSRILVQLIHSEFEKLANEAPSAVELKRAIAMILSRLKQKQETCHESVLLIGGRELLSPEMTDEKLTQLLKLVKPTEIQEVAKKYLTHPVEILVGR